MKEKGEKLHFTSVNYDISLPKVLPDGSSLPCISLIRIGEDTKKLCDLENSYPYVENLIAEANGRPDKKESSQFGNRKSEAGHIQDVMLATQQAQGDILFFLPKDAVLSCFALYAAALAFLENDTDIILFPYTVQRAGITEVVMPLHPEGAARDCMLAIIENNTFQNSVIPYMLIRRNFWQQANTISEKSFSQVWKNLCSLGAKVHTIGFPLLTIYENSVCDNSGEAHTGIEKKQTRIAFVNDIGFSYGAGIAHRRLAKAVAMTGTTLDVMALGLKLSQKEYVKSKKSILERLKKFDPDLVVCGNLHTAHCDNSLLEEMLSNWPVAFCLHDLWLLTGHCTHPGIEKCEKLRTGCDHTCPTRNKYPFIAPKKIAASWQRNRRTLYDRNLLVLANSTWAINEYTRYIPDAPKPCLLKMGCEDRTFTPADKATIRAQLSLNPNDFIVFMTMCDFASPTKGAWEGIATLASLDIPNLKIMCVGWQAQRARKLSDKVIAFDYIDKAEKMAELFQASDLVVSFSHAETLGQTLIEASFCGIPSVAYAVTGLTDAVTHGITGLLCAENPETLAKHVERLYFDEKKRKILSFYSVLHARNTRSLYAEYKSLNDALENSGKLVLHPDKVVRFRLNLLDKNIFWGKIPHPMYPAMKKIAKRILPFKLQNVLRILYHKLLT